MAELIEHYEAKYGSEAGHSEPVLYAPSQRPTDRYVAAVSTLTAAVAEGGAVLELGAGDGGIARSLLRQRPDVRRYVVTDLAGPRVRGLERTFARDPRVEAAAVDAERVDTVLGQFDAVVMVALIEHLLDPLQAMRQLRKLVAPGGLVYIDTPNIAKWTRRLRLLAGRFPSTASTDEGLTTYYGEPVDLYDEGHLHYFTFSSLSRMLIERCGFARVVPAPYPIDPIPAAMSTRLARWRPGLFSELAVLAYA